VEKLTMAITLPRGIAIAAADTTALDTLGTLMNVSSFGASEVLALWPRDRRDEPSVWVNPTFANYVGAWNAASREAIVDPRRDYGPGVDIDHVYPKSWAVVPGMQMEWVRIFPVWSEVNRSAGSREKWLLQEYRSKPIKLGRIVFATELQILKLLGHPVGTTSNPERLGGHR
jgi:hypothetical protein